MTDVKKRKKVAQAIQALLELDSVKVSLKDVVARIEDEEDLDNLQALKEKLVVEFRQEKPTKSNDRRKELGDFIVENWELIKDNEPVKTALQNAYCMGRYNKERREIMLKELNVRVGIEEEDEVKVEEVETKEEVKEEVAEDINHRKFCF